MKISPPKLPTNNNGVLGYLASLSKFIVQEFTSRTRDDEPRYSVLLVSPDRTVYTVKVEDDGTLITEKVASG